VGRIGSNWASLSAPDPLAADETSQLCRIQLPLAARVQLLLQQYPHLVNHPDVLKAKLQLLKPRYGREKLNQWYQLIDAGQWKHSCKTFWSHYDPTYTQSMGGFYQGGTSAISAGFIGCSIDNLVDSLLPEFVPTS